ncbi:ankyrin repeat-containing domain, PGG domain protein [Tanacetum coccineum]
MASTSGSNPSREIDVGEAQYSSLPQADEYPYPSQNFATSIVTVKLSGKDVYDAWKTQMLCLLKSHDMLGFIDGNGKAKDGNMKAWTRSDSLVSGWLLGSLSEKAAIRIVNRLTSEHKNADFSAKDVWHVIKCIYGPSRNFQQDEVSNPSYYVETEANSTPEVAKSVEEINLSEAHERMYWFILQGMTEKVDSKFSQLRLTPTDKITINGDTSLHVAVGSHTKNPKFLEKLLEMIPEENSNVQNSDGSTPLHVAAIVGNTEAANVLVRRNPELLFAKDNKGHTPLAISLSNSHIKISRSLLNHIKDYKGSHTMFSDTSGDELLVLAISSKNYRLSLELVWLYETIHSEAVLMAIAQNFPCELSLWERRGQDIDYSAWEDKHRGIIWKFLIFGKLQVDIMLNNLCANLIVFGNPTILTTSYLEAGISKIHIVSVTVIKKIVSPFLKERLQTHTDAIELLWAVFAKIQPNFDSNRFSLTLPQYYTNPIFEATRLNAVEVVTQIVKWSPEAIWSINEDDRNFIQYAVINRSEKIYSLLYKMSEHKNIYKTIKDPYGNNLLHLAGRLAPANKLNLISGAALQIQRELQWFKEVEKFVCPLEHIQKNYADETPEMVFTREHVDLVIEGEKWMKATAESYTITAALIVTIVFAAAITVPGGNNQDTGIPIHNNNIAFTIFAVADAISLFTVVTSLLMFLSILTTRFSVEDFLFKLPKRLIIGLTALFISTTAMIIAFGATLFLVFGHDNSWILIPIGVLTCLPISSFVTLQYPLIADLMGATYGGSIFDKTKPDEYFY